MTSTTSGTATPLRGTPRIFSLDSAKAIKAQGYGYLNAIHYMAPAKTSGYDLCPHSTPGCRDVCLGKYSGQAAIVLDLEEGMNATRASRVLKAQMFMRDRDAYMNMMAHAIMGVLRKAQREGLTPCIRLNGSTDVPYERIRFSAAAPLLELFPHVYFGPGGATLLELFPHVQFVDYTKNPGRMTSPTRPANLHLTFSRSEKNEDECLALLERGHNVAVVFAHGLPVVRKWKGFPVIDGDRHDLRHLDPQGGYVIGLTPKGTKAKRDMSGFVLRSY
jgi:hypothetical protein